MQLKLCHASKQNKIFVRFQHCVIQRVLGVVHYSHAYIKWSTIRRRCSWAEYHGILANNRSSKFSNNSDKSGKIGSNSFVRFNREKCFNCLPFRFDRVEWPGKENQAAQPKGYVYIIFESEKQVRELLNACTTQDGNYYYKISSKRIKAKEV